LVNDTNVADQIISFNQNREAYKKAVNEIVEADKFIQQSLKKVQNWHFFVSGVLDELKKSSIVNQEIEKQANQFQQCYQQNLVENYKECEKLAQQIQDAYYAIMKENAAILTEKYNKLAAQIQSDLDRINSAPKELNRELYDQAIMLQQYAENRMLKEVSIHFTIQDQSSHFTLSDILSSIALYETKNTELQIIASSIQTNPSTPTDSPKPMKTKIKRKFLQNRNITVKEYREWLKTELQSMASLQPEDEIEWSDR